MCFTRVLVKLEILLFGFVVAEYLTDGVAFFKLGHELLHLVYFFVQLSHLLVVSVIFLVLFIYYWDVSSLGFSGKIDSPVITLHV